MDADDLARGRALLDAASPRPWGITERAWTGAVNAIGTDLTTVIGAGKSARVEDAALITWLATHAAALLDAAERAARLEVAAREALAVMEFDHAVTGDVNHATNEAARLLQAALEPPKGAGGE